MQLLDCGLLRRKCRASDEIPSEFINNIANLWPLGYLFVAGAKDPLAIRAYSGVWHIRDLHAGCITSTESLAAEYFFGRLEAANCTGIPNTDKNSDEDLALAIQYN